MQKYRVMVKGLEKKSSNIVEDTKKCSKVQLGSQSLWSRNVVVCGGNVAVELEKLLVLVGSRKSR